MMEGLGFRETMIVEYFKTLRSEIDARQGRKFRIMTAGLFGVPAISFVGRYFENQFDLGEVFFLMAPIVVIVTGYIYVAENNGVMRAGRYLRREIEPKIRDFVGWEQWLEINHEKGTRSIDKYYNSCFFVVALIYFIGSMVTLYIYSDPLFGSASLKTAIFIVYICLGGAFFFSALFEARYSTKSSG